VRFCQYQAVVTAFNTIQGRRKIDAINARPVFRDDYQRLAEILKHVDVLRLTAFILSGRNDL